MRRVVVTGMGTVNPLANAVSEFWNGVLDGRSGIGAISQFDTAAFKVHFGGEVRNLNLESWLDSKNIRRLDQYAQFALAAAKEAIDDSGFDISKVDPFRCGVIVGSGVGGLHEFEDQHRKFMEKGPERISPFVIPKMIPNSGSGNVSIQFGFKGPNTAVSTACASGAHSLADAMRLIRDNQADVMLAGGSESGITPMGLGGFISAKALSTRNNDPIEMDLSYLRAQGFWFWKNLSTLRIAVRKYTPKCLGRVVLLMLITLPPQILLVLVLAGLCLRH